VSSISESSLNIEEEWRHNALKLISGLAQENLLNRQNRKRMQFAKCTPAK